MKASAEHRSPAATAAAGEPHGEFTRLMKSAVAYSTEHVHNGGIPFTAFVVDGEFRVVGCGVNRVREHHDPLAHAEVEAIRDACRSVGSPSLHGMTLLASGEPCAMCYLTALYAGISQVLFAVDRDEAAAQGFDYRRTYALFKSDPRQWSALAAGKLEVDEGMQPFQAFRARLR
jgi:guanine deaminase